MISMSADRTEGGTTLIELIVAVAIMGVAFVSIIGGIGAAIIGADSQKRNSTGGLVLASAAETILADNERPYAVCATPTDYPVPPAPVGFTVTVDRVAFWNPVVNQFVGFEAPLACDESKDNGLQLLQLSLTASGGPRAATVEYLEVVKRQVES